MQQQSTTFIDASPLIGTPYLESSAVDTPFLDNGSADSPPFFDMVTDISPYLFYDSNSKQDICVAGYLSNNSNNNNIAKLTHDPIATFNGDPSVLLIDKSKTPYHYQQLQQQTPIKPPSPTVKLETVTEEETDALFPPLGSSQQDLAAPIETDTTTKENISLDELLGFDPSSPLSEAMEEDMNEQQEHHNDSTVKAKEEPVNEQAEKPRRGRKRKHSLNTTTQKGTTTAIKKKNKTTTAIKKPKEAKIYHCHLCNHVSKRRYNLMTHIKTHDKARLKEFGCTICEKRFDRRHDRDRHLATVHRGERSFVCSDCKTHFSRRDALNRHLIQRHDYDESDFVE
ncbi:MAG: hypothetical protein EXX96DRAFT_527640 [Benjaminiella poitrasii]|nr:MAG: hypothetical protein EXX96DRAFT_527640 [Benjaminiella poitrasii]